MRPSDRLDRLAHARWGLLLVGALAITIGACATEGSSSDVVAALCAARDAEGIDDAEDLFYGGVHAELHTLADDVVEVDASVGGRLLEAKNQVEAGFEEGLSAPQLEDRLGVLIVETRTASEVVERPASAC